MDERVFAGNVFSAGGWRSDVCGEGGEDGGAKGGVCGARVVESLGDADEGFGSLEERVGVLEEKGEWKALLECVVGQHGRHEGFASSCYVIVEAHIKRGR